MVADGTIRLTKAERLHQEVMFSIVKQLQSTSYILKGGTALVMTRDSPRHSVYLDFDFERIMDFERQIRKGLDDAGAAIISLNISKDTDIVQRYKIHYRGLQSDESEDMFLRVETSLRGIPDQESIEVINDIRTYRFDSLYAQKLEAMNNRTKARDLFDLAFMTNEYGDQISDSQLQRAESLTTDFVDLADRYDVVFRKDRISSSLGKAEDTVLEFREGIERELNRRASLSYADQTMDQTDIEGPTPD